MDSLLCRIPVAVAAALLLAGAPVTADDEPAVAPRIAIIIDDLGNQRLAGERAIALPGPVACSIMPHTAHSTYLAERAHAAGKEVMLHLPMQAIEPERPSGPGAIELDTNRVAFRRILAGDLADVPHTRGINNHMGSLVTRHPGHMDWLMDELIARNDMFFIDSYTTSASVGLSIARDRGVPAARRDVFLDNPGAERDLAAEFERLKREARHNGFAIGIAHPYPATLEFLERELPGLATQGYRLVPVTEIVDIVSALPDTQLAEAS